MFFSGSKHEAIILTKNTDVFVLEGSKPEEIIPIY